MQFYERLLSLANAFGYIFSKITHHPLTDIKNQNIIHKLINKEYRYTFILGVLKPIKS